MRLLTRSDVGGGPRCVFEKDFMEAREAPRKVVGMMTARDDGGCWVHRGPICDPKIARLANLEMLYLRMGSQPIEYTYMVGISDDAACTQRTAIRRAVPGDCRS